MMKLFKKRQEAPSHTLGLSATLIHNETVHLVSQLDLTNLVTNPEQKKDDNTVKIASYKAARQARVQSIAACVHDKIFQPNATAQEAVGIIQAYQKIISELIAMNDAESAMMLLEALGHDHFRTLGYKKSKANLFKNNEKLQPTFDASIHNMDQLFKTTCELVYHDEKCLDITKTFQVIAQSTCRIASNLENINDPNTSQEKQQRLNENSIEIKEEYLALLHNQQKIIDCFRTKNSTPEPESNMALEMKTMSI